MSIVYDMFANNSTFFGVGTLDNTTYNYVLGNPNASGNIFGHKEFIEGHFAGAMTVLGATVDDYVEMRPQGAISDFNTVSVRGGLVYTNPDSTGDNVYGGDFVTTIHGENAIGSQYLFLGYGGGTVFGGNGFDHIYGGPQSFVALNAGGGTETIDSGTGASDKIFAGSGKDTIYVESVNAIVTNSTGNDTISFSANGGTVILGAGNSTIYGTPASGGLTVIGGAGTGNLTIAAGGGAGNNIIGGSGAGTNILFGGVGVDTVHGGNGAGTNVIAGYLGNDVLYGGTGSTNNYFDLVYDVHGGDLDQIVNWTNTATTHDWLQLPVVAQAGVNFVQNGADVYASLTVGTGVYGIYINNASLADVTAHTFYYG